MNENLKQALRAAGAAAFANNERTIPTSEFSAEWVAGWDAANAAMQTALKPNAPEVSVADWPVKPPELVAFVQAVQNNIMSEDRVSYPNLNPVTLSIHWGRKFARVVTCRNADGSDLSVYCFVELSTGDIYKPASYTKQAKHARGNIRRGDQSNWWNGTLNSVGVRYLR